MIKKLIHQKDTTILNINVPNIGASKYTKKILTDLKGEIGNIIKVQDFNTPLSTMARSSNQKTNEETLHWSHMSDQVDLQTCIQHSRRRHILLKCTQYILPDRYDRSQKSLTKFKKIEIIPATFSDPSGMKLETLAGIKVENAQICGNEPTHA